MPVDELSLEIECAGEPACINAMRDVVALTLVRLGADESVVGAIREHAGAAAERVFGAGGSVCHVRLTCKKRVLTIVVSSSETQVWKTSRTLA